MNALIIAVGILNNRELTGSIAEEIIAAFRLLGIADEAADVINNLIQAEYDLYRKAADDADFLDWEQACATTQLD
jgi:hypothetical protein